MRLWYSANFRLRGGPKAHGEPTNEAEGPTSGAFRRCLAILDDLAFVVCDFGKQPETGGNMLKSKAAAQH